MVLPYFWLSLLLWYIPCFLHRCIFNDLISFVFLFTLVTITSGLPNHVKCLILTLP